MSDLIRGRTDAIIVRFIGLLRQRRASADEMPTSALLDHIPSFLASLAEDLRRSAAPASEQTTDLAQTHGVLRWQQGFDLGELIDDYAVLHEAILVEADAQGSALSVADTTALVRHIAEGVSAAVEGFVAVQNDRDRTHVAQLENVHRLSYEILSTISHELRTPLHVIRLCTQLLRTSFQDERLTGSLEIISRNVERETNLVEELIEMAALVTGRIRLAWGVVDLRAAMKDAVGAVEHTASAKRIEIRCEDPGCVVEVSGDRERLYQCTWQLLLNALRLTPAGGRVEVCLRSRDGEHELAVTDSGPCLSEAFLAHVFDPFAKPSDGSTRTYDGLGLGLSLVRHLVELHGGTVDATSVETEQRTTFAMRLPARSPR